MISSRVLIRINQEIEGIDNNYVFMISLKLRLLQLLIIIEEINKSDYGFNFRNLLILKKLKFFRNF